MVPTYTGGPHGWALWLVADNKKWVFMLPFIFFTNQPNVSTAPTPQAKPSQLTIVATTQQYDHLFCFNNYLLYWFLGCYLCWMIKVLEIKKPTIITTIYLNYDSCSLSCLFYFFFCYNARWEENDVEKLKMWEIMKERRLDK